MKVAIFGLKLQKNAFEYIQKFFLIAQEKQIELIVFQKFKVELEICDPHSYKNCPSFNSYQELKQHSPDLLITFGGDGTILNAVTYVRDLQIPILGVNTGRLGFLASINLQDFLTEINDFLNGNYIKSPRTLLELISENHLDCPIALNEFAIARKETTSMITVNCYIDNSFLNTFWADGLILSTPTGSTGYSLSAGGPIIHPNIDSLVITPIAPHNLNVRPLLINDQVEIKLNMQSRANEYSLSLDSRLYSFPIDTELILKKANYSIILAQSKNYNYFSTLRDKLNWGQDLRN